MNKFFTSEIYEINKVSENEYLIESFIKEFMPICYEKKNYNFTYNKNGDKDIFLTTDSGKKMSLQVSLLTGKILVYDFCTGNNGKLRTSYHKQVNYKGVHISHDSWLRSINWCSTLHDVKDMNKNEENKRKAKHKQGKFLNIEDAFSQLENRSYKNIIKIKVK